MAETTFTAPIGLEGPAQPAQEQPRPEWARKSLHSVKMPRREVQLEPQWEENAHGPGVEVRWREAAERPAQLTQHHQQQEVNYMEDQSSGHALPEATQQPQQALPPDPTAFDMWDEQQADEYRRQNDAYIDSRVQAALQPHHAALQEAELWRDYNAATERYGRDENFTECMHVALENCAEAQAQGKKFSIIEQYQKANDASAAKVGRRGSAHLPKELTSGKNAIGNLGRIMFHNRQTGRAKPFGSRNWKG